MNNDLRTLLYLALGVAFIYSGLGKGAMSEGGDLKVKEIKRYTRNVRKSTRRNKGLARKVAAGRAKILNNPLVGEIKHNYNSNATVIGRLQMEHEGTFRALKIHKQQYQILYTYDEEENMVTLIAFGSQKGLFRGATP